MGRPVLDFGGIDCKFVVSARLLPHLLISVTTVFITRSSGIDDFSSHQQSNVDKCETVLNT